MLNKPFPFKGLDNGMPIIIPIKGSGFINHGSGLNYRRVLRQSRGPGSTER